MPTIAWLSKSYSIVDVAALTRLVSDTASYVSYRYSNKIVCTQFTTMVLRVVIFKIQIANIFHRRDGKYKRIKQKI